MVLWPRLSHLLLNVDLPVSSCGWIRGYQLLKERPHFIDPTGLGLTNENAPSLNVPGVLIDGTLGTAQLLVGPFLRNRK